MGEPRETITGKLGVDLIRKRRHRNGFQDLLAAIAEDALGTTRYYPPRLWLTNDRLSPRDRPFIFKFRGVPALLKDAAPGSSVTVVASVDEWPNGIGGYLVRPRVVRVSEEDTNAE